MLFNLTLFNFFLTKEQEEDPLINEFCILKETLSNVSGKEILLRSILKINEKKLQILTIWLQMNIWPHF